MTRRRMPGRRATLGGGGVIGLIVVLLFVFLGGDPAVLLQQGGQPRAHLPNEDRQAAPAPGGIPNLENDPLSEFVRVVLRDTEDVWEKLFRDQLGQDYDKPTLAIFSGSVDSACGYATAAVGPFYCPADDHVYVDLSFFGQLRSQLGAPGDFAMAYVIAHEVAHHVQNELGRMSEVHSLQKRVNATESNRLSVRLELQADYLAGVWAHHAERMKQILEPGDIDEALRAASAIGDDRLQKSAQGYVVPDSFTHGTSAQRLAWFRRGLESGDLRAMQLLFNLDYDRL